MTTPAQPAADPKEQAPAAGPTAADQGAKGSTW
jgi:hypothetical protein